MHVGVVLLLTFLLFPMLKRFRNRIMWWDLVAAALAIASVVYMIMGGDDLMDRNTTPDAWDIFFGVALIVLVMEAMRRTAGWIMPAVTGAFILYALFGAYLPHPWTHKGYEVSRLVGHLYMTLEGIFGVAVDVSSSLIILFTIFGAFLQFSGAGKFYIDFSFSAMGGKPTGAGRTVVLASFLLGGPSGSGVATTVTLGSVAWPMLAKVGYESNAAGGLLAAGGLGAIISPPVLGAAAFLIAEFLKISYLDVLLMACIPTLLFYLALFLMVEIDARKLGMHDAVFEKVDSLWHLTRRYWFHFLSLISIVIFMMWGFSPVLSVFWATIVSAVASFLRPECSLIPYDVFRGRGPILRKLWNSNLVKALEGGTIGVLNVAATCAGAGIIVGVVTLTGLGLKFSSIVIDLAGGSLLMTAVYTSLVVWIVGLAVPVTASYIICAVIAAPGPDQAGRARLRCAHVHLLLRRAVRGVAAHGALAVRRGRHHRGRSLQDHHAMLEVHRAGVPGAVHVRARPERPGPAADGIDQGAGHRQLVVDRRGHLHRGVGVAALAAGFQGWAFKRHHGGRAGDVHRGRLRAGLSHHHGRPAGPRARDRGPGACSTCGAGRSRRPSSAKPNPARGFRMPRLPVWARPRIRACTSCVPS